MDASSLEVRISNSQVNNYMECQKKFELAHIDKLMKLDGMVAIRRGQTGHQIMKAWGKAVMAGASETDALAAGINAGSEYNMQYAMEVFPMIAYWIKNEFPKLGWKIVEVEKTYYVNVGVAEDGRPLVFPYTIDLLVEAEGRLVIVDWKFQADKFDEDMIVLHPQLKRYIVGLRSQKINVHHGIFVTFRTRANLKAGPEERTELQDDKPTVPQLKEAMSVQIEMMNRIASHKGPYLRVLNKNMCSYCPFKKICLVETMGEDSSLVRQFDYTRTDYDYDE